MEDSIFTKIIKGEIPCYKIYEDENTLAFLDTHPVQPGHTLVIPKKQIEFLWDLEEADYQQLMAVVKKIARHLREKSDKPYVGVKVMGIDVPHTHVHLVPFSTGAEYYLQPDLEAEPDHAALAEVAKTLAF